MSGISSTHGVDKSLYVHKDPRKNLYKLDKLKDSKKQKYPDLTKIKANACAVACLISKDMWTENLSTYSISTSFTLSNYIKKEFTCPLKEGEKFRNEPCVATGTGFLVSHSKLMTAGHCVRKGKNIEDIRIIFNFQMKDKKNFQREFDKREVYRIKHIIYYQYDPKERLSPDWALIKLDRTVVGIEPLQVSHTIQKRARVYMLGHPMGLPLKFSGEASVKNIAHVHKFECDLAAFRGNSGSPVIDRVTHAVVGMLVNGFEPGYEIDQEYKRNAGESRVIARRITQEETKKEGYELCQKITPIILDPHRIIAEDGRAKRKTLSDRNSKEFEIHIVEMRYKCFEELKKIKGLCDPHLVSALAVDFATFVKGIIKKITKSTISHEMESYRKTKEAFGGKINLLEARCIAQLSETQLSSKDKVEVARCMAAYNTSSSRAIAVHNWETSLRNRFSPDKILDLHRYQTEIGITFDFPVVKRILKYLHQRDPENKSALEENSRKLAVIEAVRLINKKG